jgi:hypothetical protein
LGAKKRNGSGKTSDRVQRTCKLDVELKIGECASAGQIRDRRKVDIQMLDT